MPKQGFWYPRYSNITFTIVDTEVDAWLLENSLIKKHQPRYNVMLKDDKTYPWIIIKNENYPAYFLDTAHRSRWLEIPGAVCIGKHDA